MSHKFRFSKKFLLFLYVALWAAVLTVAACGLTRFLLGTLNAPLAGREAPRAPQKVFDNVVALTEKKVVRYLGEWELQEPRLPGHFHHIGRWYEADKWNFCIKCHGQTPHSNNPQVRAFLNMHNLFISCQVCHVREKEDLVPTRFAWSNITDGKLCPSPDMAAHPWGEYGAKIVPLKSAEPNPQPVTFEEEEAFAAEYFKRRDKLTDQQKVLANEFIHRRCVETPVRCSECHTPQQAFLPYPLLGYTSERAAFLMSAEVVDLVRRYETFHLPNLLNPHGPQGPGPGEPQP
ncbi:MAG: hypothetical protein MUC88_08185 [Planctomycetes bacterium]|nr:hypothetical protein [Planctomycetota bacterium]